MVQNVDGGVIAIFVVHDLAHEINDAFGEACSIAEKYDELKFDSCDPKFRDAAMLAPILHLLTRWLISNRRFVKCAVPSDDRVFGKVLGEPILIDSLRRANTSRSWQRLDSGEAVYLSLLAVHADWQGRGIASRLMHATLEHVQRLGYERALIVASSVPSQKILAKMGSVPSEQFVYKDFELLGQKLFDFDEPQHMKLSEFHLRPPAPRDASVFSSSLAWVWRIFNSAKTQLLSA